ncbi:tRNA-2-methylthio-N(6)-dimethylallyladenosine synthase [Candidatus Lokiarchaeum ossiferum]
MKVKLLSSTQTSSYCIHTYGCTFNAGDSLKIAQILNDHHFYKETLENSDYVIINTCAVKHSTEIKIISEIRKLVSTYPDKSFIITGCLPLIDLKVENLITELIKPKGFILHPHKIGNIIDIIKNGGNSEKIDQKFTPMRDKSCLDIDFSSYGKNSAIIQISEGCNNHCTYCCTTNARGNLVSFNFDNIVAQVSKLAFSGVKEFFFTSQDLGNYKFEGKKLHDLLNAITKIEGEFLIRLGMLNPDYLINNLTEFKEIFNDPRFYRFLHIPIQSASNMVLSNMRRHYSIEQVDSIIKEFQKFDPLFSFGTDIIVGYPTEQENDYQKTKEFISEWQPQVLNISKYTVRPNTDAKKLKQLPSQIIKKRSQDLSKVYLNYSKKKNHGWLNWKGEVFVNEFKKDQKYPYMGRNLYYVPVLCKEAKLGQKISLKIIDFINHSLIGC